MVLSELNPNIGLAASWVYFSETLAVNVNFICFVYESMVNFTSIVPQNPFETSTRSCEISKCRHEFSALRATAFRSLQQPSFTLLQLRFDNYDLITKIIDHGTKQ